MRLWRSFAARVAAYLRTPLPLVMGMYWDDLLLWHEEARRIHSESYGLLAAMRLNQT